jgi:undecaprenyl diphosphate synthase
MNQIKHLGVIMDGNRRWAKSQGLMSYLGHNRGTEVFGDICGWCLDNSIEYLTVYAFSTENWQRSEEEVTHLFKLLEKYFTEEKEQCIKRDIRLTIIGERNRFDKKTISMIEDIETCTKNCSKLKVQIAFSYGGRDEIIRAIKKLFVDIKEGKTDIEQISEETLNAYLDTAGMPDVDLVIRTGGAENRRLSNFLPWQTVYSELFFSDLLWPEFSHDEFEKAMEYYNSVKRKLGK